MAKKKTSKKTVKKKEREWNIPPSVVSRRNIRNRLFNIRRGTDIVNDDLKEHIEKQFQIGMNWKNFTFLWDISPTDHLKVIREDQWFNENGGYDPITGRKSPTAFTRQE